MAGWVPSIRVEMMMSRESQWLMEMPHVEYVRLTSRWTGNDSFVSCSFNVESVDGEERYSLRSKADGGLHGPATVPGSLLCWRTQRQQGSRSWGCSSLLTAGVAPFCQSYDTAGHSCAMMVYTIFSGYKIWILSGNPKEKKLLLY